MSVDKVGERYRCDACGNEVVVSKVGGGTLVCCGRDIELTDSEKHSVFTTDLPDSGGG